MKNETKKNLQTKFDKAKCAEKRLLASVEALKARTERMKKKHIDAHTQMVFAEAQLVLENAADKVLQFEIVRIHLAYASDAELTPEQIRLRKRLDDKYGPYKKIEITIGEEQCKSPS